MRLHLLLLHEAAAAASHAAAAAAHRHLLGKKGVDWKILADQYKLALISIFYDNFHHMIFLYYFKTAIIRLFQYNLHDNCNHCCSH